MNKKIRKMSIAQEKPGLEPEKPIKWLRSREVKKMLGITDSTLQSMRAKALIPAYKLGDKLWFYNEDEINQVILKGKSKTKC
ncbi:MAG TPA: helix-turn-helix domain-containing protein [Prolixibacteraceae bacterium]|nr:helix-turn-helix domain-containing protein [Prolixibacteraceae bacterium]